MQRVQQEAAFILHHRPFRDTSQILDVLSREHGKIALVARGSRGPKSRLKGVLRPFMPLTLSWVQRSDMGTLTGAELQDAPLRLGGDALLSAYYLNELLLHFLHRHDPQTEIFELYRHTLVALAASTEVAPCLRQFEIELLGQLGYAMNLEHEADTLLPLSANDNYEYRFEQGPVRVARESGELVFSGAILRGIAATDFAQPDVLRAANRLLREVIGFHLGGKQLKSRKVMLDLHRQRSRAS